MDRMGVIGAGFHATTNVLPALVRAGIEIGGLATRDLDRSASALQRFGSGGVPYSDASALLANDSLTAVVVVAQPADQFRLTLQAVRAGRHVFADKPLGWTAAQATEVADAADAAGVVLMVGFMKRYAPIYRQLRELIADETLGEIKGFEISFGCDSTPFCSDAEQFVKLAAIHVIDLVRYLFGEVVRVQVNSNCRGPEVVLGIGVRCASGVVGTLTLSGLPGFSSESERVEVIGSQGYARAENLTRLTTHRSGGPADWRTLTERTEVFTPAASAMSGSDQDLFQRGFVGQLEHFVACVDAGSEPNSSGRDNVRTMQLCEAILTGVGAGGDHSGRSAC